MPALFPSFAKVNLSLEVIGRRSDGYHELRTVFQTIELHDLLEIEVTADPSIALTCDDPTLTCDDQNLVVRAARLLQSTAGVTHGARIHLQKRIPMQAGLGGGSSNAAVTLLALEQLWGAALSVATRQRLAAQLGADVPFFLVGGTALGLGRGDRITPLPDANLPTIVVVNPKVAIPTGPVFRGLQAELTDELTIHTLTACSPDNINWLAAGNDLEAVVFRAFPLVREVRDRLRALGAHLARMSGSGSTVFGLFEDAAAGEAARQICLEAGWLAWTSPALGRETYARRIGVTGSYPPS
ncbi:MAG: 4-(cytidine 5'-diphospho)-2-C-methyl-D-erythritol kinase [Chloracidobacterium sp.]|uniref:4-diphosphocytidyl-2-C-methyl-D-erythritol kinase n=1 Tax=Chloracidobacterium validum TaxID=2821543 RepID=A0ABX8B4Y0_9BACT|nr:4-(cytidine 5'-diphospho)-2-C-methyl-D-erythritol kinase [Chloracidobacterium validum]QUW02036.1 4-(cytidine 5'-diphospho)-2-C-methyl-D-erythritol kinase [Chloracidobacterium validum]